MSGRLLSGRHGGRFGGLPMFTFDCGDEVGVADPVNQRVVQLVTLEAGRLEHGKTGVRPLQPALLRSVAGKTKAARLGGAQPHSRQLRDGFKLGLQVAVQQHAALRVIHQHRGAKTRPPTPAPRIVKLQLRLQQTFEQGV